MAAFLLLQCMWNQDFQVGPAGQHQLLSIRAASLSLTPSQGCCLNLHTSPAARLYLCAAWVPQGSREVPVPHIAGLAPASHTHSSQQHCGSSVTSWALARADRLPLCC